MNVRTVAIKNIDKLMAGGKHYASYKKVPVVVGLDGVGELADGTIIYAHGKTGTMAQKAIVSKSDYVPLPENSDLFSAAALPNAAMGSYLPLKVKGGIKKGSVVLINGGTGITGKLAIQLAKHYGASRVIVSGRIEGRENDLLALGADELISTQQDDSTFLRQIKQAYAARAIDIVIDYLWGSSLALIVKALAGEGQDIYTNKITKIITVGSLSGEEIALSSNSLRSSKMVILGSGLGSFSKEEFRHFHREAIPEMFQLLAEGRIQLDIEKGKLEDIESLWNRNAKGKRIVVAV